MVTAEKPPRHRRGGRVDPSTLPQGPNGWAYCRYCLTTECRPPRVTFCSAACVVEHKIRTSSTFAKRQVYLRDKGVCALCGLDTKKVAKELLASGLSTAEIASKREMRGIPPKRRVWKRKFGGGLWDMDHLVSVRDGGGDSGLAGLRTLCLPCHRVRTAEQCRARAQERARARKPRITR